MSVNLTRLGSRVKKFRKQKGFTQERLAERTRLSVQHIRNIETGKKRASIDAYIKIADELGVTVDILLLGNCDNEIVGYVCEFAELIIECNMSERDSILDAAIEMAKILKKEN